MKVIDLLNKIVNYEGVPKKITIQNDVLIYNENHNYALQDYYYMRDEEDATWKIWAYKLNDEVEIIEEDKKIEKIDYDIEEDKFSTYINGRFEWVDIPKKDRELYDFYKNKINELTDEINKLKGVK